MVHPVDLSLVLIEYASYIPLLLAVLSLLHQWLMLDSFMSTLKLIDWLAR
jgi:hypothetical protein